MDTMAKEGVALDGFAGGLGLKMLVRNSRNRRPRHRHLRLRFRKVASTNALSEFKPPTPRVARQFFLNQTLCSRPCTERLWCHQGVARPLLEEWGFNRA